MISPNNVHFMSETFRLHNKFSFWLLVSSFCRIVCELFGLVLFVLMNGLLLHLTQYCLAFETASYGQMMLRSSFILSLSFIFSVRQACIRVLSWQDWWVRRHHSTAYLETQSTLPYGSGQQHRYGMNKDQTFCNA